jgi:hypothetical protein
MVHADAVSTGKKEVFLNYSDLNQEAYKKSL